MKKLFVLVFPSIFILLFGYMGIAAGQTIPTDGLVAYYPFNGNANDESENGNDGTVNGATLVADRYGEPNSAYSFDGYGDYIEILHSDSINLKEEMTIGFWINVGANQSLYFSPEVYSYILHKRYSTIIIPVYDNGTIKKGACEDVAPLGEWVHYSFVFSKDFRALYRNGNLLILSKEITNSLATSSEVLRIGTPTYSKHFSYNGLLDEVALYNRALSASEIRHLYSGIEEEKDIKCSFPDDSFSPAGSIHAYPNMIWSANNKMVSVTLNGYIKDELSIVRDSQGIGISSAYILIDGTDEIVLRNETTDLLDDNGNFSADIEVEASKGAEYLIELYATDTNPDDSGGPNYGLVDSTYIRVPHDMSDGKSGK